MEWFDGHLDLAYIADHGRDLTRDVDSCGGGLQPASVTFPALRDAGVGRAVATVFVRRRIAADPARNVAAVDGPYCYGTPEQAFAAAVRQIELHRAWEAAGHITQCLAKHKTRNTKHETHAQDPLQIVLALEGAACLRSVEDLHYFHDASVRAVSLAWAEGSVWSGGDQSGGDITPPGRILIDRLDDLQMIHDVSHLSEQAFWTLLRRAKGPVIASHSNCRALLPGAKFPERHLSDAQIKALAENRGVIGINLFARFLIPADELMTRRASVADVIRHLDHMSQLAGRRNFLALGSDMDSGFGTDLLPEDLQGPRELIRLAEALSRAGWTDAEIQNLASRAWAKLFDSRSSRTN